MGKKITRRIVPPYELIVGIFFYQYRPLELCEEFKLPFFTATRE